MRQSDADNYAKCSYPGCQNEVHADSLCEPHYWLRTQVTACRYINRAFFIGNVIIMFGLNYINSEGVNPLVIVLIVNLFSFIQQVFALIFILYQHLLTYIVEPIFG